MTVALITGVSGQDGSYLAESLVARGYEVHGVVRDPGEPITAGVVAHDLDLAAGSAIGQLIRDLRPHHVYNLAAVSSVFTSWSEPSLTARLNGLAVAEMLAAVRELGTLGHETRFVQASSAEMFGMPVQSPQTESTPIRPTSPYGAAKAYAHGLVGAYRGAGVFATSLVLYNHESPRRPETFVTRKITAAAARIALGQQERLELGNLDARRDWGWAPDYADALYLAATAAEPDDFIIATGVSHSVADFVRVAFERAGVEDWASRVDVAPGLLRTGDAAEQVGDASKARSQLNWAPTVDFDGIVAAMVEADLELARHTR
ncbi:MAG: GDP-mannose 4,6-dehydratase [Rhodoglobus sp.]|nr:GDP-mannose 4,6-dehydratase [Rhodoglobus sp.]